MKQIKIKISTLTTLIAVFFGVLGLSVNAHAFKMPSAAKGKCPSGYYRAVPVDRYSKSTHYLPSNVCVRFEPFENMSKVDYNFYKKDIIQIYSYGPLRLSGIKGFDPYKYEPIVGHYAANGRKYFDSHYSKSKYRNDYRGKHPVIIRKAANAAIRIKGGLYLIDKQTIIFPDNPTNSSPHSRCPSGYSTVGNSYSCYSQNNGLKLNSRKKLELVELKSFSRKYKGQDCPMGMSKAGLLGSNRGLCTSTKALFEGVYNSGISTLWSNERTCPGGEYYYENRSGACLPQMTVIYCNDNRGRKKSLIWPTHLVNDNASMVNFSDYYSRITFGKIAVSKLRAYNKHSAKDDRMFKISPIDKGYQPVIHYAVNKSCSILADDGGWSVDPVPVFW